MKTELKEKENKIAVLETTSQQKMHIYELNQTIKGKDDNESVIKMLGNFCLVN